MLGQEYGHFFQTPILSGITCTHEAPQGVMSRDSTSEKADPVPLIHF